MNAASVNGLALVIHAAMQTHTTAAGIAMAVEPAVIEPLRAEVDRVTRAYTFDTAELKRRVDELQQQLAVRTFYLADSEGAEDGPTLHSTHVAAIAWCDEVEPGEWFEGDDGVWVQCNTDPDTDRPTTRGAGTVTPLTVSGDGIVAEAERIRQELVKAARKLADLQQVRADEREFISELQVQQGEVMKALGCDRHDEWEDVLHRARQLAAQGGDDRG